MRRDFRRCKGRSAVRPDQVAQGFIQSGLENLCEGCEDCIASLGNLFQGLVVLTVHVPVSSQNPSCFNYHKKRVSVVGNAFCHVGPGISGALSASDF